MRRSKSSRGIFVRNAVIGLTMLVSSRAVAVAASSLPPELAALQEYYPAQYAELMTKANSMTDPVAIEKLSANTVAAIFAAHRDQLNDNNLDTFFAMAMPEMKKLRDQDAMACVKVFTGKTGFAFYDPDSLNENNDKVGKVIADILIQIATNPASPAPPLSNDQFSALLESEFKKLPTGEQTLALPLIESAQVPTTIDGAQAVCDFYINLFSGALSGPPGTLRRFLASGA